MLGTRENIDFNKLDWDQERFGMACTGVPPLSELLGALEKLCFDTGRCDYEKTSKDLKDFYLRLKE
jgi:hypothetical protein